MGPPGKNDFLQKKSLLFYAMEFLLQNFVCCLGLFFGSDLRKCSEDLSWIHDMSRYHGDSNFE